MARTPSSTLTDAELRIMRVLWERDEATIGDVVDAVDAPLARATVQTMLRILERKRYVRHRADGRTFVYRAAVDREAASGRAISHLLARFFDRSPVALVEQLLDEPGVDAATLSRMRRLLEGERS